MLMLILTVAQRELEPDEQGVTPVIEVWRAMIDEPDRQTPHAVIDGRDRDTVLRRALEEYDRVAHEQQRERAEPGAEGKAAGDPPAAPAPARRLILTGSEDERGNEIRLGGETKGRTKDLARASALAHAMLEGVGEWRDQMQLGAEGYVLHRRRPLHDEELRALAGALPAAAENEAPVGTDGAWEEKAENYRRTIELACEHPPVPSGPRLLT